MKIYTKTGDSGESGLLGGERVAKDHPRLVSYGTVDELNACLGWLQAAGLPKDLAAQVEPVQNRLFDIGAELATPEAQKLEGRAAVVDETDVSSLEQSIDAWEQELEPLKNFILPGGSEAAARAHVVRTVARRTERVVIALARDVTVSPVILKYVNRLSDWAFVLSRVLNKRVGHSDREWQKK